MLQFFSSCYWGETSLFHAYQEPLHLHITEQMRTTAETDTQNQQCLLSLRAPKLEIFPSIQVIVRDAYHRPLMF